MPSEKNALRGENSCDLGTYRTSHTDFKCTLLHIQHIYELRPTHTQAQRVGQSSLASQRRSDSELSHCLGGTYSPIPNWLLPSDACCCTYCWWKVILLANSHFSPSIMPNTLMTVKTLLVLTLATNEIEEWQGSDRDLMKYRFHCQ